MILVDIYVASLGESFDFRVDETAKVVNVVSEISEMLCEKYKTKLNKTPENFMLCAYEDNKILDGDSELWKNNIRNGSKLMLV